MENDRESRGVPFYLREDIELAKFTKNDGDPKPKLPPGEPEYMTATQFKNFTTKKTQIKQEEIKATETIFDMNPNQHLTEEDFEIIKVLGRGAFGKVNLCSRKNNNELYAIKIMNKADIIEKNQIEQIKEEMKILVEMNHPF